MRKMKIFTLSLITFFIGSVTIAQQPNGMANRAAGVAGRFYGKIIDSITKKPIDATSVQLYQARMDSVTKQRKEVIVTGMLTQANGDFSLENVPVMGQYTLRISGIGFKPYEKTVSFFDMKDLQSGGRPDMPEMMNERDKDI